MKRILFRADDLGYSEGINFGIAKSVKDGLIRSVGLMINMSTAEHGFYLLKDIPVCMGLHANITVGKPVSEANRVPSLVKESGEFHSSSEHRSSEADLCDLDDVITEIEAQYSKYCELAGEKPHYIDSHAITPMNFMKGVRIVAERHGVKYSHFVKGVTKATIGSTELYFKMESEKKDYDPEETFRRLVDEESDDRDYMFVLHPGYLDGYILKHSSLTTPRPYEVDMLCNPNNKKHLEEKGIICIDYDDL